ncbi:MAG TPA: OmpA family protein [Candidatus Acidoferrum sp.]|nr:OmpA family protein [Candidatus Acidoferrum sp.]
MTRKGLLIAGVALLLGAAGVAAAALPAFADDLQGQTKQDFIDALAPKTRGLSLSNQGTQGTQETTNAAPQKDMHIQFEFGSAKLTASAKAVLDELGAALQSDQLAAYQFSLVGHTDAVGSDAANLKLSQARAASVKDYLIGQFHIDPARLESSGVGESDLADPSNPNSGVNRRVVITNIGS